MPPKKSKKNVEKEKAKIVEDKTFGLKNKKNSKKVQKYVETVKKQVNHKYESKKGGSSSGGGGGGLSAAQKSLMAMRLAELNAMHNPVKDKVKKLSPEEEAKRKKAEEEEAERVRIANLPVEDQIEEERAKIVAKTPVTLELFNEWKARKAVQRKEIMAARTAAAQKNISKSERARGQGLTGRQLFEEHQNLFVDDEGAEATTLRPEGEYIGDSDDETEADLVEDGVADINIGDDVAVGDESLFS